MYRDTELRAFWKIMEDAPRVLHTAPAELSQTAGLGANFFTSVVREKRSPKLANFLRALTAVVQFANERLEGVAVGATTPEVSVGALTPQNAPHIAVLAHSLHQLAREELERLGELRPNDEESIKDLARQKELLAILASGLDRIASALASQSDSAALDNARAAIDDVAARVRAWWAKSGDEAVDWTIRFPIFAGAVSLLNLAGADMLLGTAIAGGIIGGSKAIEIIKVIKGAGD